MYPYIIIIFLALHWHNNIDKSLLFQQLRCHKANAGGEYAFWNMLNEKSRKPNLIVCPKVNMEGLVSVNFGSENV